MALFVILNSGIISAKVFKEQARDQANKVLEFLLPTYIGEVGAVEFNFASIGGGFLSVDNIYLFDPQNDRTILINSFKITPSFSSLVGGNLELDYLGVDQAEVIYRNSESQGSQRWIFPINILDIPANILSDNGRMVISDMKLAVLQYDGKELLAVRDLSANLTKEPDGYAGRILARHADKKNGAFSFRAERIGDQINWKGNARNYSLSTDSDIAADFDLDLQFENVLDYDLTEQTENVPRPQDFLTAGTGRVAVTHKDWTAGGNFVFDPEDVGLHVNDLRFKGQGYEFDGRVDFELRDKIIVSAPSLNFSYPTHNGVAQIKDVSLVAQIDTEARQFELGEIRFEDQNFSINGRGSASYVNDLAAQIVLKAQPIQAEELLKIWPKNFGDSIYNWVNDNLKGGRFENLRVDVSGRNGGAFEVAADVVDARFTAIENMPPLQVPKAKFRLTKDYLLINAKTAQILGGKNGNVNLTNAEFWIDDFGKAPITAEISGGLSGETRAVVAALSQPPIDLDGKINFAAERFGGQMTASLKTVIPFMENMEWSDIKTFNVDSQLSNFVLRDVASGKPFSAKSASLKIANNVVNFSANGQLGKINANVKLSTAIRDGAVPKITASGTTTRAALADLGVSLPSMISGNQIGYDIDISTQAGLLGLKGSADIRDLALTVPVYGQIKPRGTAGRANFDVSVQGKNINIKSFDLNSNGLSTNGNIEISNGQVKSASFRNAKYGNKFSGTVEIGAGNRITIRDGFADLSALAIGGEGEGGTGSQNILVRNMRAALPMGIDLRSITGQVSMGRSMNGELIGVLAGRTPVNIKIYPRNNQTLVHVTSDKGGNAMRDAGLFGDLKYGDLDFKIRTTDRKGLYAGKFRLSGTQLTNSNVATQLLQVASVFGFLDPNGIYFDDVSADLLIYPDRVSLYSGYAYGPSLGLTLGGDYFYNKKAIDFQGVLTPAFVLNGALQKIPGLGELLSGNLGEGVIGVSYAVNGSTTKPNISANPLSLLTPGKLRELWSVVPQKRTIPEQYRIKE